MQNTIYPPYVKMKVKSASTFGAFLEYWALFFYLITYFTEQAPGALWDDNISR